MWEAMMMLRLIASMSPRLSLGQRARHAATPAALPADTLRARCACILPPGACRCRLRGNPLATDIMTAELHEWPRSRAVPRVFRLLAGMPLGLSASVGILTPVGIAARNLTLLVAWPRRRRAT
ncbi:MULTISPECIES: hypothetical protein [unclassified Mesorhizobium]|uniref:hypothetical protein n=1 Tax=unclassified Mesorhizobium TaxID=325217 RepID=UPI001FDF4921|nr:MULTISPECIES: hypothetical protein [unclassified Mesorhizobium]